MFVSLRKLKNIVSARFVRVGARGIGSQAASFTERLCRMLSVVCLRLWRHTNVRADSLMRILDSSVRDHKREGWMVVKK